MRIHTTVGFRSKSTEIRIISVPSSFLNYINKVFGSIHLLLLCTLEISHFPSVFSNELQGIHCFLCLVVSH